ncbi:hypothetical protein BV22DRAFT_277940 [Leucogyrophana mollusca]|uniref:Uncharacterized protein n=1 Tax=Leucogyrophana mollusca TaxID=85980 RepID=A0ACB8BQ30_9AGAM|nr:hypothetical protein BV22DRAFT_277940 [Leucogyrophana mollusca]
MSGPKGWFIQFPLLAYLGLFLSGWPRAFVSTTKGVLVLTQRPGSHLHTAFWFRATAVRCYNVPVLNSKLCDWHGSGLGDSIPDSVKEASVRRKIDLYYRMSDHIPTSRAGLKRDPTLCA